MDWTGSVVIQLQLLVALESLMQVDLCPVVAAAVAALPLHHVEATQTSRKVTCLPLLCLLRSLHPQVSAWGDCLGA